MSLLALSLAFLAGVAFAVLMECALYIDDWMMRDRDD